MTVLITIWGARLTYNFWRKGGYSSGEEDYRWPFLRRVVPNKVLFHLFNLFFIAIYQNILLYLFTSPLVVCHQHSGRVPFGLADVALTGAFMVLLAGESIADQQQWDFQSKKWALIKANQKRTGAHLAGFFVDGLFRYSRHPNAFCEIMLWWVVYGFSVVATGQWLNPSVWGTFLLTLLFQGSTTLTEYISKSKYPTYGVYQKTTSRLIPLPPTNRRLLEETIKKLENQKTD
uniref:Steroid 5-alpha reductase C-terminal domain-containing protein n=1 Tax=Arcella intermedia TaxID=1963864 RepID=A0A6B2LCA5_9EUKA